MTEEMVEAVGSVTCFTSLALDLWTPGSESLDGERDSLLSQIISKLELESLMRVCVYLAGLRIGS